MSLIFALALAAATSNPPALPRAPSLQEEFDRASAAEEANECAKAVPLFEALEQRPEVKPGSLPASAIAVRKGKCLVQIGRLDEGERSIVSGLPGLERAGSAFTIDIGAAYRWLGNIALSRSDYALAKEHYGRARAGQIPEIQMTVLAGLIKASSFDTGPEPLAYADEGLRLAAVQKNTAKGDLATFHTLRARILLNRGETEAAFAELKKALDLSGGLTRQTTLGEASMRGDLALAAMLLNRKDDARKYLAYTGAGRIEASPFATAVAMSPPDCGQETGLRPEDFAVVEFSIAEDGSVNGAETVFSRGGPAVAAAFARAVRNWYWRPEQLAKIPLFYRAATRVELRCTTAGGPVPGLSKPLIDRFGRWALPHLGLSATEDHAALIGALRRKLSDSSANEATTQIAAAGVLSFLDPRINAETIAMLDRAIALTGTTPVPPEVVNSLRIFRVLASPFAKIRGSNVRIGRVDNQSVLALLQDPAMANDAIASNSLRLMPGLRTNELVQAAAEDQRLPEHHPLRQLAWLTLANQAAEAGDLAAAQQLFAKTGLTEQQCALIGPKPALRRTGASSDDFPREAAMYGFEGWVRLEFDITADGRTANARPVIAYPPFVFVDAARGMTRGIRYESSFRPAGGMACSASGETIRFILP